MEAAIRRQKIPNVSAPDPEGVFWVLFGNRVYKEQRFSELRFSFFGRQTKHSSYLLPTVDIVFVLKIPTKFVIHAIVPLHFGQKFILIIIT